MLESWRPLAGAVALVVTLGTSVADAQTVIVRGAPLQSTVELVFNADTIGTVPIAPGEDTTLPMDLFAKAGKSEASVHVFVDACTNAVRVMIVEAGLQPPAERACNRKQIAGLFDMRRVTTFVIDVGGVDPVMWLRQGPAPLSWLGESAGRGRQRTYGTPPTHLMLSGSGGFTQFSDALASTCGTSTCTGNDFVTTYRVGATYWLKPFLAADVSFLKPSNVVANGSGDGFHFQSVQETQLLTVAANVGGVVGPARIYGQAGGNYHQATVTTTETVDVSGSQTLALKTAGWGWLFGGGVEFWATRYLAIYGEGGVAQLKGAAVGGGEGAMADRVTFAVVGGRIHIGR